jgi:DNA-directed RNA polymerase III subunit RPC2
VNEETGQVKLKQAQMGTMTVRDLLNQGIVEYVDCNEENNTLIAVTERDLEIPILDGKVGGNSSKHQRYTHLEIDPFTVLGVIGGIIPVSHPFLFSDLLFLLFSPQCLLLPVSPSQPSSS